jgi:hypothetical protein
MKFLIACAVVFAASVTDVRALPTPRNVDLRRVRDGGAADKLQRTLPLLREGDIVFIGRHHPLYRIVAETSGSWESHLGIVFRDSGGGWTVAQSTIPVSKYTPLERFVSTSENGRFLVRRVRGGLTPVEIQRLRAAADSRMGKLYDSGFGYESKRQFCSKFVYDSFLEATGKQVGRLETFRDVFEENPKAPVGFWRVWFFGRIPWNRYTVTTTSQLHSDRLVTVFDSEAPVRRPVQPSR